MSEDQHNHTADPSEGRYGYTGPVGDGDDEDDPDTERLNDDFDVGTAREQIRRRAHRPPDEPHEAEVVDGS